MHLLEYRLHELYCSDGAAKALLDDLTAAHPELRLLFDSLRRSISLFSADKMRAEIADLRADLEALDDEINRLKTDLTEARKSK